MSGIVGMVNADKAPVDRELLARMTDYMTFRGPDVRRVWAEGSVGLGHALLRTTDESAREDQPLSLDNHLWIVADARVDDRSTLVARLRDRGEPVSLDTPDPNLILHAYRVWGIDCLDRLLGDFAFAIWDSREERLFCARDHFGVKPFFYSHLGRQFAFSNTLNCLRLHPSVSDKLNDLAIADFLLFGLNQEADTSTFTDIQRLPAAHRLIWTPDNMQVERYWTLPTDGYIRYKKDEDYVEHFLELMRLAVGDRLRTDRVAVYMSGGLDSTSVMAIAKELYPASDLRAYTTVFDRLIPDEERYYSGLAARHLNIPIHYQVADDLVVHQSMEEIEARTPEPALISLTKTNHGYNQQLTSHARVVLSGEGGDAVFHTQGAYSYGLYLIQTGQIATLVAEWLRYWQSHQRFPQPGIRARLKRWLGIRPRRPYYRYPVWLNSDLEERLDLKARWDSAGQMPKIMHPTRPEAVNTLVSSNWAYLFEGQDAGTNHLSVEVRYPYFDLRLVNFLLSIPVVPYIMFKEMLRVSMKRRLPESVRSRPKTPVQGDPLQLRLNQLERRWIDDFNPISSLSEYVDRDAIPQICGISNITNEVWVNIRPISLNYWLQYLTLN